MRLKLSGIGCQYHFAVFIIVHVPFVDHKLHLGPLQCFVRALHGPFQIHRTSEERNGNPAGETECERNLSTSWRIYSLHWCKQGQQVRRALLHVQSVNIAVHLIFPR